MPKVTWGGARSETPEGEWCLEVSGNRMGRGLETWDLACAERKGRARESAAGAPANESGDFSTSESSTYTLTLWAPHRNTGHPHF